MSSNTKIDLDAANFTTEKMIKLDKEDKEKKDEEERRDKMAQKGIEKVNSAFAKVAAQTARDAKKDDAKLQGEVEEAKKKDLLHKIGQYIRRFPFLSGKIPVPSARASIPELTIILDLIREEMDSQRSLHQLQSYTHYGLMMMENVWGDGRSLTFLPEPLRFNISGISGMYSKGLFNEDLLPILMEIDIEYPWIGRQSLMMRSAEAFATVLMKVHMYNTNPAARKLMNLSNEAPTGSDHRDL